MVAEVRERWAVIKQAAQKFYGEIFNLRKLNNLEVWKQYPIEITNRFTALVNLKLADISRTKRRYNLKVKFEEHESNSKVKNIRG